MIINTLNIFLLMEIGTTNAISEYSKTQIITGKRRANTQIFRFYRKSTFRQLPELAGVLNLGKRVFGSLVKKQKNAPCANRERFLASKAMSRWSHQPPAIASRCAEWIADDHYKLRLQRLPRQDPPLRRPSQEMPPD